MQATTATCLAGGIGSLPPKFTAYCWLLARRSSVTDICAGPPRSRQARSRGQAHQAQTPIIPTGLITISRPGGLARPDLFGYIPRPVWRLTRPARPRSPVLQPDGGREPDP